MTTGTIARLWSSAGTFRQDTLEKLAFILLNLVDLVLTVLAVSLGLAEHNPLIRHLLAMPLQLVLVKVAVPLLIAWLTPGRLLLPAILLLCLLLSWNAKELLLFLL